MRPRFFLLPVFVLLLIGAATPLLGREAREQQRIDFLLRTVGELQDAVFIRNGTEYDGKAAAAHLKQKLDYGGERLKTAEMFIEYCATKSSISGRAYQIRLKGGKTTEAGPYLRAKLAEFDHAPR